ncbi:MAG: ABC transporter permease [Anaerolineae bacterium]|nr:ABC transporter permease [Anaerolineae bacterium]
MSSQTSVVNLTQTPNKPARSESLFTKGLRRLWRDRLTMMALFVILVFSLLAIFADVITTHILRIDPNETNAIYNFEPYGAVSDLGVHYLGTDDIGRDQLARLLHAGRVSLSIGFFGAVASLTIGLSIGIITGYFGGVVDDIFNWLITTLDSIPALYLLILISAVLSPTAEALIFVIALISWTGIARIIRGQTLAIRGLDYVLSARALGASSFRIMFAHIAPNLISITAIVLARGIGNLMLAEAGLSFLGLGVLPPQATWGNMLTKAQQFLTQGPHLIPPPGLAIWISVLCLYIIGDGIRDAFDPTQTN